MLYYIFDLMNLNIIIIIADCLEVYLVEVPCLVPVVALERCKSLFV